MGNATTSPCLLYRHPHFLYDEEKGFLFKRGCAFFGLLIDDFLVRLLAARTYHLLSAMAVLSNVPQPLSATC